MEPVISAAVAATAFVFPQSFPVICDSINFLLCLLFQLAEGSDAYQETAEL